LQILDGRTGKVRQAVRMPKMPSTDKEHPTSSKMATPSPFVNFSGKQGPHEILVKDRYTHFWIYNNKLQLL